MCAVFIQHVTKHRHHESVHTAQSTTSHMLIIHATAAAGKDTVAYFKGNKNSCSMFNVYTLFITPTCYFDTLNGSLKSGYRFVQSIYYLSYTE